VQLAVVPQIDGLQQARLARGEKLRPGEELVVPKQFGEETLAGQLGGDEILSEFETMWAEPGNSGGKPFKREELYDERLNRYAPR
jgi:hypothetical protein